MLSTLKGMHMPDLKDQTLVYICNASNEVYRDCWDKQHYEIPPGKKLVTSKGQAKAWLGNPETPATDWPGAIQRLKERNPQYFHLVQSGKVYCLAFPDLWTRPGGPAKVSAPKAIVAELDLEVSPNPSSDVVLMSMEDIASMVNGADSSLAYDTVTNGAGVKNMCVNDTLPPSTAGIGPPWEE